MLIIPVTSAINWKNPPVLTLLIIVSCIVVFTVFQRGDNQLNETVSMSYGYIPAFPELRTLLTHLFLHGGPGHLAGNMIFLWIVGCVLETGCGRAAYLFSYFISGILAALLFGLIHPSVTPLIGASGAISGLMGMLTVLYGKKTIRVFYSLGFYFDYIRLKAILLLPLWIGNELFLLFFGGISNVAYVAHIGGLIAGAACGIILLKIPNAVKQDIFQDITEDTISPRIEKALHHVSNLELDEGREILENILSEDPGNITALRHLFYIHKQTPSSRHFHEICVTLLQVLLKEPADTAKAIEIYREYQAISPVPKLPPALLIRISLALCTRQDLLDQAASIIMFLLKKAPETQGIPTVLFKLSRAYQKKGHPGNREKCLKIIQTRYPQSHEARILTSGESLINHQDITV